MSVVFNVNKIQNPSDVHRYIGSTEQVDRLEIQNLNIAEIHAANPLSRCLYSVFNMALLKLCIGLYGNEVQIELLSKPAALVSYCSGLSAVVYYDTNYFQQLLPSIVQDSKFRELSKKFQEYIDYLPPHLHDIVTEFSPHSPYQSYSMLGSVVDELIAAQRISGCLRSFVDLAYMRMRDLKGVELPTDSGSDPRSIGSMSIVREWMSIRKSVPKHIRFIEFQVLNDKIANIAELEIQRVPLSGKAALALFQSSKAVNNLAIVSCGFTFDDGTIADRDIFRRMLDGEEVFGLSKVCFLNLSENQLCLHDSEIRPSIDAAFLSSIFTTARNIVFLNLASNKLSARSAEVIALALSGGKFRKRHHIVKLDLSENPGISSLGQKEIIRSLKDNRDLAYLDMRCTSFEDFPLHSAVGELSASRNCTLIYFQVSSQNEGSSSRKKRVDEVINGIIEENRDGVGKLHLAVQRNDFHRAGELIQQGVTPFASMFQEETRSLSRRLDEMSDVLSTDIDPIIENSMRTVFDEVLEQEPLHSDTIDALIRNPAVLLMRYKDGTTILQRFFEKAFTGQRNDSHRAIASALLKVVKALKPSRINSIRIDQLTERLSEAIHGCQVQLQIQQEMIRSSIATQVRQQLQNETAIEEIAEELIQQQQNLRLVAENFRKGQVDLDGYVHTLEDQLTDVKSVVSIKKAANLEPVIKYYERRMEFVNQVEEIGKSCQLFVNHEDNSLYHTIEDVHNHLYTSFSAIFSGIKLTKANMFELKASSAQTMIGQLLGLSDMIIGGGISLAGELAPVPAPTEVIALPFSLGIKIINYFVQKHYSKRQEADFDRKNKGIRDLASHLLEFDSTSKRLKEHQLIPEDWCNDLLALSFATEFAFMIRDFQFNYEWQVVEMMRLFEDVVMERLVSLGEHLEVEKKQGTVKMLGKSLARGAAKLAKPVTDPVKKGFQELQENVSQQLEPIRGVLGNRYDQILARVDNASANMKAAKKSATDAVDSAKDRMRQMKSSLEESLGFPWNPKDIFYYAPMKIVQGDVAIEIELEGVTNPKYPHLHFRGLANAKAHIALLQAKGVLKKNFRIKSVRSDSISSANVEASAVEQEIGDFISLVAGHLE